MVDLPRTHWIWLPNFKELVKGDPLLARFRKCIFLDEIPESLVLKVSADTRYKLYINGHFAEFGPARGDVRVWYADEVEIAPWLISGENVVAAEVLRYPLAYRYGNFGMSRTATPGLFVEELTDRKNGIFTDESWKCMKHSGYKLQLEQRGMDPLMQREECFGEDSGTGWKLPGFDDQTWEHAAAYNIFQINEASCPGDLSPRAIPYMRKEFKQFQSLVPKYDRATAETWKDMLRGNGTVKLPAGETVIVEINAGEEMTGYLSLRFRGGADTRVKILCAESYYLKQSYEFSGLRLKGDRCDWNHGVLEGSTDIYHVAGFGMMGAEEIYEPFWFRTFRFIQLEIQTANDPCEIAGFDYLETGYPLNVKTKAKASDPDFDGIWNISLRTLKRCMHETYMDCPFYEQLQYAMDARSEILYTYSVSADDRLARQCMDDFRRSQRTDGLVNACYPHWGPNVIPCFSIYYILMVYDHMMYFGDRRLIRKHLGAIDNVLEFFHNHLEERGLVGKTGGHISQRYWSFIDWSIPWGESVGTPPAGLRGPMTVESLLYIYGLQHGARLCQYVGRMDTANEYMNRAKKVQQAVNAYCRDEAGFYLDGPGVREYSQHAQVFAILTDTVPVVEGRALLMKSLADENKFAPCSVSMMFYLFRALEKTGDYEKTYELWELWRQMLRDHLTTCVENGLDGRSDCHAWGSLILYELPAVILGVRPGAPGYEKIVVSPKTGYLSWAKGDVITPWGNIRVAWEKADDGTVKLQVKAADEILKRIIPTNSATLINLGGIGTHE